MALTFAELRQQYETLLEYMRLGEGGSSQVISYHTHGRAILKLLPMLENHASFRELFLWPSHYTLVLKTAFSDVQICVWGEAENRYQVYLYDPTIGETGQMSDEKIVSGDEIIATLESYVQKLKQPTAP
jgi:hypothetical protein